MTVRTLIIPHFAEVHFRYDIRGRTRPAPIPSDEGVLSGNQQRDRPLLNADRSGRARLVHRAATGELLFQLFKFGRALGLGAFPVVCDSGLLHLSCAPIGPLSQIAGEGSLDPPFGLGTAEAPKPCNV